MSEAAPAQSYGGAHPIVICSCNGANRNNQDPGTDEGLQNVIWDGARFIGVGAAGTVITSP